MKINITTKVTGGHLIVYVITSSNITILNANDDDAKTKMLVQDKRIDLNGTLGVPAMQSILLLQQ